MACCYTNNEKGEKADSGQSFVFIQSLLACNLYVQLYVMLVATRSMVFMESMGMELKDINVELCICTFRCELRKLPPANRLLTSNTAEKVS